ncbi:MAG TPA: 1,4-alpha-glucan branching protein domain-containing protein, partial [Chloroflexota bacterium]|nr:1,4-alpha-glucan branching protein domain-containing protein [Chloroflexota bacterium]
MLNPKRGAFALLLHSHLPYVRQARAWPHGEEMVHEAICDSYLPLLDVLYDLAEQNVPFRIAIGITPVLAEQLADPLIVENFRSYMGALQGRIEEAIVAYQRSGDTDLAGLAAWYVARHQAILDHFNGRYGGNIVQAFRRLADQGLIEIVGSAATHAFMPLLSRDSSITAQIATGLQAHERHFGRKPAVFWLPECGYRPAYYDVSGGQAQFRPGLESHLERHGLRACFADSTPIDGSQVADLISGSGASDALATPSQERLQDASTSRPHLVADSSVAVFFRDALTSRQVWSAEGYPGHATYREFHKKDASCGLRLWCVTGPDVDLADKELYDPELALHDVAAQADHFVALLQRHLAASALDGAMPPFVLAPYDTELFGHWWFEGVAWLEQVLRRLAEHPDIELTTPTGYLDRFPPTDSITLPESSWGAGSDARTWQNDHTSWMWSISHQYERQMEDLLSQQSTANANAPAVLAQIARELLLLQGSDWPFLISTGQAPDYASQRFRTHAARFDRLVDQLLSGRESSRDL